MEDCDNRFSRLSHVSFVATACEAVSMSKTANPRIVADGFGMLVPMPVKLARCIEDLDFFPIVRKTGSDPFWPMSHSVREKRLIGPASTSKICSFFSDGIQGRWEAWKTNVCTNVTGGCKSARLS